jgi:integrase
VKDLTPGQWDSLLSYMLLSLFTQFDPRRNQDYQLMYVVKTPKQATDESKNYLTLSKPRQFIFHKYKTAKKHGTQSFPVPESLYRVLDFYLARHPLTKQKGAFPLLVHSDGSPLSAVNSVTRILNRIFGKRVGSTMLRHIYLSAKYDVEEMNETADRMGHTGAVQRTYLKKEGGAEESSQSVEVPLVPSE